MTKCGSPTLEHSRISVGPGGGATVSGGSGNTGTTAVTVGAAVVGGAYSHARRLITISPVSDVRTMSQDEAATGELGPIASAAPARITRMDSWKSLSMAAATPQRLADMIWLPCPRSDVPVTTTTVPDVPLPGFTFLMMPGVVYANPSGRATYAPVSPMILMSPIVGRFAPARMTTSLADAFTTDASTPASVTAATGRKGSMRPEIVIRVPCCPEAGTTAKISPGST